MNSLVIIVHSDSSMIAFSAKTYSVKIGWHYIVSYICYITFIESDYFLWVKKTNKTHICPLTNWSICGRTNHLPIDKSLSICQRTNYLSNDKSFVEGQISWTCLIWQSSFSFFFDNHGLHIKPTLFFC